MLTRRSMAKSLPYVGLGELDMCRSSAAAASAATLPAFSSVSHRPLGSPLLTADRLQSEQKEEEGGQDLHCKLQ